MAGIRKRQINRLFNGLASLRSYEVEEAIRDGVTIVLEWQGQKMTLAPDKLKKGFSILGGKKILSKYNKGQSYNLIDFRWLEDKASDKQMEMFNE
jgi:hypothetical protein